MRTTRPVRVTPVSTHTSHRKLLTVGINALKLLLVMLLSTALSMLLRALGASEINIVMLYLLGILLFSYLARSYFFSLAASLFGVLFYNFFFTEPLYTFQVNSPDYPVTFFIMFLVGSFTSMLTIRIKKETLLAEEREARIKALYQIERLLLGVKNSADLAELAAGALAEQFSSSVNIQFFDPTGILRSSALKGSDVFYDDRERLVCREAYLSGNPCGRGTKLFSEAKALYMPISSHSGVLGVIGIAPDAAAAITGAQLEFLETISAQVAIVLERELLYQKQEETQVQIQHERLRADMLRAISHDLRTPLTGIMGSASTLLDNFESISDAVKKDFLKNICDETGWLSDLVENILNMTRFDEGRVVLKIEQEAAEELIAGAIGHVKKRAQRHTIQAEIPSEIILLEVDGVLVTQVLVNLLDNALHYTPEGSLIIVSLKRSDGAVIFEVRDNGPGIPAETLPHLFDRVKPRPLASDGGRHGFGLGLLLCKSIVEAHGGAISIRNIEPHGTSVTVRIPEKEGPTYAASHLDS